MLAPLQWRWSTWMESAWWWWAHTCRFKKIMKSRDGGVWQKYHTMVLKGISMINNMYHDCIALDLSLCHFRKFYRACDERWVFIYSALWEKNNEDFFSPINPFDSHFLITPALYLTFITVQNRKYVIEIRLGKEIMQNKVKSATLLACRLRISWGNASDELSYKHIHRYTLMLFHDLLTQAGRIQNYQYCQHFPQFC